MGFLQMVVLNVFSPLGKCSQPLFLYCCLLTFCYCTGNDHPTAEQNISAAVVQSMAHLSGQVGD